MLEPEGARKMVILILSLKFGFFLIMVLHKFLFKIHVEKCYLLWLLSFLLPLKLCSVFQSCPTLCNAMDRNLPGASVHGILQARILESCPPPGDLPDPGIEAASLNVSYALAGRFFTARVTSLKLCTSPFLVLALWSYWNMSYIKHLCQKNIVV